MKNFSDYVMNTYKRLDVSFSYGDGVFLFDSNNEKWLDMLSGIGVVNLGHSNPRLIRILKKQAKLLWHTSNLFHIENQYKLAHYLSEISFKGNSFFCNSGAEANEAAIKLARKWGRRFSDNKYKIIALKNSFHGRTIGALTLTGQEIYQKNFTPLLPGVFYVEPNNISELRRAFNNDVCAMFMEIVQGEGGVFPLSKGFVEEACRLCKNYNALLIIDEVQTGVGRTGKPFAYQHFEIEPDAITLAKGLANGLPIGVLHARDEVSVFEPGDHASTFGGGPLITAVAYEVLRTISKKAFLRRINEVSSYLMTGLNQLKEDYPHLIREVRGIGLMIGIVSDYTKEIFLKLFENRIIVSNIKNEVIRLLPPLIITKSEVDYFLSVFKTVLKDIKG